MYIRYFWQGNHHTYGHIQCVYTVLVNPTYLLHWHTAGVRKVSNLHKMFKQQWNEEWRRDGHWRKNFIYFTRPVGLFLMAIDALTRTHTNTDTYSHTTHTAHEYTHTHSHTHKHARARTTRSQGQCWRRWWRTWSGLVVMWICSWTRISSVCLSLHPALLETSR